MNERGKAYLNALSAEQRDKAALAFSRGQVMYALVDAKIDIDLDIDGIHACLDEAWRLSRTRHDEFEMGAVDTIKLLLLSVENDRMLLAPLRSGNARNLLIHLDRTGETSDAELFEADVTTEAELKALASNDYVFGALAGPVRLYRICNKGRQALALADRLLPR